MRAAPSILSAAAAILLLGCSDSTGPSDQAPSLRASSPTQGVILRVSPATATLQHGGTLQLTTIYSGHPVLSREHVSVAWRSSNESVATVSPSGLVRGVSGGEASITASWGGYQASALVTVAGPMKKHGDPTVCMTQVPRGDRQLTSGC